jgi:small subunit ribosomal protein S15
MYLQYALHFSIHQWSCRKKSGSIIDCNICYFNFKQNGIMALTQERKQELMGEYQIHETDTGSADLQVAFLTTRINQLTEHLKVNKKDHSSRRGLLKMIGKRKRLLQFIKSKDQERYQTLIGRLGVRR